MSEKKSRINIDITLGEDLVPLDLAWTSKTENQIDRKTKAMLLSLFDRESKETLKIDLWTKDMQVVEMDRFFYHTLRAMTDTYFRATNNHKVASAMRQFVQFFGEETEILKKSE